MSTTPDGEWYAQSPPVPWVGGWSGVYRFPMDGSEALELPADKSELGKAVFGIYVVAGIDGVSRAWSVARKALEALRDSMDQAMAGLGDASGMDAEKAARAWWSTMQSNNIDLIPSPEPLETRKANDRFLEDLQSAIDKVVYLEETAQRWYEDKLVALIGADLAEQAHRIDEAWIRYNIVDARQNRVALDEHTSASGLRLLGRKEDQAPYHGSMASGVSSTADGSEGPVFPTVLVRLHEAGVAWYDYAQAARQARSPWAPKNNAGSTEGYRVRMRAALAAIEMSDFIVFAAFHDVVERSTNVAFDPARCEQLVIKALIAARTAIPRKQRELQAARLFASDQAMARPEDGVGQTAAMRVIEKARRTRNDDPGKASANPNFSPWLQAPYHARMSSVAAHINAQEPPFANLGEGPVEHLLAIFESEEDRALLDSSTRQGTFAGRARVEMVRAFEVDAREMAETRVTIVAGLTVVGLLAAPFTGGGSLLAAAGICDALFVAEAASKNIAGWLDRQENAKLVVDEIGSQIWAQPAVAEVIGLVIKAGFTIAQDVITQGMLGKLFDAIACIEFLGGQGEMLMAYVMQASDGAAR
ncbi:MAG TPA: hypothetical protein VN222_09230 [Novosphingobium sp.]|nr:hypothetical protein [Novosphingobium sp.]